MATRHHLVMAAKAATQACRAVALTAAVMFAASDSANACMGPGRWHYNAPSAEDAKSYAARTPDMIAFVGRVTAADRNLVQLSVVERLTGEFAESVHVTADTCITHKLAPGEVVTILAERFEDGHYLLSRPLP